MIRKNKSSEEEILLALSKGDEGAFETLFLRYQPQLVYFISGFVKNSELSRDIFLTIWDKKEKYSTIQSFKSYLFKMAKNTIFNYYDHSLVKGKYVTEQLIKPNIGEDTEEAFFLRQLQENIDSAIKKMSPQRQKVFTMSRIYGWTNSQIADELNISKRTVENHLTAALSEVRKTLTLLIMIMLSI